MTLVSFPVTTRAPETPRLKSIEPISETLLGSLSNPIVVKVIAEKQWQAYSFSSLFILDVATKSRKDHKLLSATYNVPFPEYERICDNTEKVKCN